jgi:hypothetical protein
MEEWGGNLALNRNEFDLFCLISGRCSGLGNSRLHKEEKPHLSMRLSCFSPVAFAATLAMRRPGVLAGAATSTLS